MPDFNETTVAQSFFDSSPRARYRSRERHPQISQEEVHIRRRRSPRDAHSLSPRPVMAYAPSVPDGRARSDSSGSFHRHQVRFNDEDRHDNKYDDKESPERRIIRRDRAGRRDVNTIPVHDVGDNCSHSSRPSVKNAYDYDSDSDSDDYHSSDEDRREQEKLRNKKLLYVGLACATTIAASNNIYQSTKTHHARRRCVEEGEMSRTEAMRLRKKALLLDALSVGVVAVGLNNVRMGWKKVESMG